MKAAIFDLDGTLAETVPAFVMATIQALDEVAGQTVSLEDLRSRFGPTEEEMLADLVSPAQLPAVLQAYYQHYTEHLAALTLYGGIFELLDHLRQSGWQLGLFTNKGRVSTLLTVEALGLGSFLHDLQTGSDGPSKPDPTGALMLLDRMGVSPAEAWMVGDTVADLRAGRAAGMRTAAALWGRSKAASELAKESPDVLAESPLALLEALENPDPASQMSTSHGFTVERLRRMEARRGELMPASVMLADLQPDAAWQVADLGCGIGFLALPLAEQLTDGLVWAIDRSPELVVETARRATAKGLANVRTRVADVAATGLASASVDAVVISQVLHDLEDARVALAEVRRILKAQGLLYILEWQAVATEFGPPLEIRIPSEQLLRWLSEARFTVNWFESGPHPFYRILAASSADHVKGRHS